VALPPARVPPLKLIVQSARGDFISSHQCNSSDLQDYRAKVAELGEFRRFVGDTVGQLRPEEAQRVFDELTLRTKEVEDLRNVLGRASAVMATYGVNVINHHTISFVIPRGCSRIEILKECQELERTPSGKAILTSELLEGFARREKFTSRAASSEHICIDAHVRYGDRMNREDHETFIRKKGLTLPTSADLAAAFALNWVATGESLCGRWSKKESLTYYVRCEEGSFKCGYRGLVESSISDCSSGPSVTVSARIPRGPNGWELWRVSE
jgi:hypothetical protein